MIKSGRLPAERLVEQDVLWRGGDPLLSPDHVRDPHVVIVDYIREVVGRKPVRFQDDLIVDEPILEGLRSTELIDPVGRSCQRHHHPHGVGLTLCRAPRPHPLGERRWISIGLGCFCVCAFLPRLVLPDGQGAHSRP